MNRIRRIKKYYRISAAAILAAAVLVSAYFVYAGFKVKDDPKAADTSNTKPTPSKTAQSGDKTEENYQLVINKINTSAPILINVDGNNKDAYNKALENGVAHLKGSALPGRSGNVFIFGHSSYYENQPGNYKQVFAKLNDLAPGDIIEIQANSTRFVYKVLDKKIIEPNDVSVANQNYNLKQLTLMTCWPVGSTAQRLVIIGELVE